jgi:hypothetical protein
MELKSQVANAITLAIIGVAFWYILLGYKSHRLIRVRGLFSIFLWSGLWTIGSIIWNFAIVLQWPCFTIAAVLNVLQVLVAFSTAERCLMILIHYAINHEAVNSTNQSDSIGVNGYQSPFSQAWSKWIFQNRKFFTAHWNSRSKIVIISAAFVFALAGILCIGLLGKNHDSAFCSDECYEMLILYWRSGFICGAVACNLAFTCALRFIKVKENFYLKQEMAMFAVLAFPVVLSFVYRCFAPASMQIEYDKNVMWYGVVFLYIVPILDMGVVLFVVFKARQENQQMKGAFVRVHSGQSTSEQKSDSAAKVQNARDEFYYILSSESDRQKFKSFLITEFSVENLLFWEAINLLQHIKSLEEKKSKALQIVMDFCSENSKHEVNLSFTQATSLKTSSSKLLEKNIEDGAELALIELIEGLKKAKESIESLMFEDSYRRFRKEFRPKITPASIQPVPISLETPVEQKGFPIDSLTI